MPFRVEADLREPLVEWLHDSGFLVYSEVAVMSRRADLLGLRTDGLCAIEMKLRDWRCALRQAMSYQVFADWAWIAMPLATAAHAHRHRWRLEDEAVGLLAVDDSGRVREAIPARPSPRLLPYTRDGLRVPSVFATATFSPERTGLEGF